jgi:hypothetical protein
VVGAPTCWLSGRMHAVWSPDGPQVGGTACMPYPARLSVVVSYLDRGVTGVCSHVSKSRLVGVGGGCRPPRRGQCHDHCGLVSSGLAWAVERHGSGWTGVSEATVVAGDTDCSAGIPTGKHEFGPWRLSAGGPAQVQRRSQQVARAGGGSVLHHRRGLSVLSARSSSPSAQRTGLRVWRGADPSLVRYVPVVGSHRLPGSPLKAGRLGPALVGSGCGQVWWSALGIAVGDCESADRCARWQVADLLVQLSEDVQADYEVDCLYVADADLATHDRCDLESVHLCGGRCDGPAFCARCQSGEEESVLSFGGV